MIAVTAASGRLGHALLRELVRQGHAGRLVAVARDPSRVRVPGITVRSGDYASEGSLATALAGVDTVVMISAPVAGGTDRVPLHRNVIGAARASGVRRVIFTSIAGNGVERDTLYGPTQEVNRATEDDLRGSGLQWVIGRNALYLELDLAHIRKAADTGVYANPGGEGRAPYLTIDEIAGAYAALAMDPDRHGEVLNITGETLTQAEIVAQAGEVFGIDVRYEVISDEACIGKFRQLMPERGEAVARMLAGCFQAIRAGAFDVPSHYAAATGRPAKTVRLMLEEIRDAG